MFAKEELVEKGVQPGARGRSAGCVVNGREGEVMFTLDKYGGGGTVSPHLFGIGVCSRGWGDGEDELVFVGVRSRELCARWCRERVLVRGCLTGDAVVSKSRGVEE